MTLKIPKVTTQALPMPTTTKKLINRAHNSTMTKANNQPFKMNNKVKEQPHNY